jgi:hypothetical protein
MDRRDDRKASYYLNSDLKCRGCQKVANGNFLIGRIPMTVSIRNSLIAEARRLMNELEIEDHVYEAVEVSAASWVSSHLHFVVGTNEFQSVVHKRDRGRSLPPECADLVGKFLGLDVVPQTDKSTIGWSSLLLQKRPKYLTPTALCPPSPSFLRDGWVGDKVK